MTRSQLLPKMHNLSAGVFFGQYLGLDGHIWTAGLKFEIVVKVSRNVETNFNPAIIRGTGPTIVIDKKAKCDKSKIPLIKRDNKNSHYFNENM